MYGSLLGFRTFCFSMMMYGSLRCFATPALLVHSALPESASADSFVLRVRRVKTSFACARQALPVCLGFRTSDLYIIIFCISLGVKLFQGHPNQTQDIHRAPERRLLGVVAKEPCYVAGAGRGVPWNVFRRLSYILLLFLAQTAYNAGERISRRTGRRTYTHEYDEVDTSH